MYDVWGPAPVKTSEGYAYYVHFTVVFSIFTWLYLLKRKSDTVHAFTHFKSCVELQTSHKIKALQIDVGGEYQTLILLLNSRGIRHKVNCPYTLEQNGKVELKHRQITEVGLTLLAQSNLPLHFWGEDFQSATYLTNRLPNPILDHKSPLERLTKTQPDYMFLKVFGYECYPYPRPYNSTKFSFKSKKCVFLGYNLQHKGYKCFDPINNMVYITRHVQFNESVFPYAKMIGNNSTRVTSTQLLLTNTVPTISLISPAQQVYSNTSVVRKVL